MTFEDFLVAFLRRWDAGTSFSFGSAFLDELFACDRALLANAFVVRKDDPFGKDSVAPEAVDFVRRNW